MSEQGSDWSHLVRFGIVEDPMCVCLKDYETVDHLIWHYERFGSERYRLIDTLSELNVLHGTPVRDLWSTKVEFYQMLSGLPRKLFHSFSMIGGL
jgi:hypothetical protein